MKDIADLPRRKKRTFVLQIRRIRVHDLRHSHASLLIEMGISILYVSERLGHEDIQTTLETYAHLYPHKNEQVLDKLNALCA